MELLLTRLKRIPTPGGDVLHALKHVDPGFSGFGEAYFSTIEKGWVKGWKRHERMVLNFVVAHGLVQVSVVDESSGDLRTFLLGPGAVETHARLTVPPGLWVAFGGVGTGHSILLNLASLAHDPNESTTRPLDTWNWSWESP